MISFDQRIKKEREALLSKTVPDASLRPIDSLPKPVQRWLSFSRLKDNSFISSVFLKQDIQLKMKPSQKNWLNASADQLITLTPPAFNWSVQIKSNPLMYIKGRDQFRDGKGEMLISLWGLIPLAHAKPNHQVNQASLQRFLAEIIWYPSAALLPYIQWQELDHNSARATMTFAGTSGSGVFTFDSNGAFLQFSAMRYKDVGQEAPLVEWVIDNLSNEERGDLLVPVHLTATWKLDTGDWTWLGLKVKEINYRVSTTA